MLSADLGLRSTVKFNFKFHNKSTVSTKSTNVFLVRFVLVNLLIHKVLILQTYFNRNNIEISFSDIKFVRIQRI